MAQKEVSKDIEAIKADVEKLRSDIGSLLGSLSESGGDRVKERTREELEEILGRLNSAYSEARAKGEGYIDRVGEEARRAQHAIEERPLTGILVALGVGVALGTLLSKR